MSKINFKFNFVKWMYFYGSVSLIAILGSFYLMGSQGLNFGTDFKGGVTLQYRFSKPVSDGEIRQLLEPMGLGDFSVQKIGEPDENRILIKIEKQEELETLSKRLSDTFAKNFGEWEITLEQEASVGPKAGADLRRKAQLAIIVSWLLMLIYIGYRFDFSFAPGAILALIHDVLVTLGAFALSGREVGLTVIAALLTITGFSVNDTIVIYDRIRENLKKFPTMPLAELVNRSLNETLSRTIITSFTVFLVVILMYLFGEGEFQNFGFAMIVGVVAGSYSTLFIATPSYLLLKKYAPRFRKFFGRK